MSNSIPEKDDDSIAQELLANIPDGVGCTEIWEQLSEERANADD